MEEMMAEPEEILPERNVYTSKTYDGLRLSKTSIEDIVAKMLDIKKEGRPESHLRELVTQVLLDFVSLRQANRSILLEEDRVKSETERAKTPVDFTTLQLHNMMYEKNQFVKAIKACKDFRTKYPDIDLVPEEEFFSDATKEIKSPVLSSDSNHDLMLKRLNYELFQRKELCNLWDKLEQQKKALQETIASRKKFLSSLPSHLKALKKASLPVQHQLGLLHTKKIKQQQLADLLPPPLYVTYSQLFAQREAFGENIEVEITGNIKDALAFACQLSNKDTATSTNLENSKLEDDVSDYENDGQRRRKRPKKVPGRENLDHSGIYQSHPLKVSLHVHDDEASNSNTAKLITLKFEYLIKLNVVCVGAEFLQIVYCATCFLMMLVLSFLSSQPSSASEILVHLMKGELYDRTNGLSIWQALIFCQRCLHWFQFLKIRIWKLLSTLPFYRVCHCIVSRIGLRQLCKGFVLGKNLSWLISESLPRMFIVAVDR